MAWRSAPSHGGRFAAITPSSPARSGRGTPFPSTYLVSAFVGLAAGLCAIAVMVLGPGRGYLMTVSPVADPGWPAEWASALVPASAAQEIAFTSLMGVLTAALLLAAGAALACGVLLLAEERIAATGSVAIQSALGIDRWRLTLELVRDVGVRGCGAGAFAFCVVLSCGLAIRWTWPGQVLGWSSLDWALLFGAVVAAIGIVIATTVLPGLALWRHRRLFTFVSRPSSNLPDRGESLGRDVTVVCQVAVAVSVLVLIGGLVGSSPESAGVDGLGEDTVVIPLEVAVSTSGPSRARLQESLLAGLAARPDIESVSIASSGALLGLGANGVVEAHCGRCIIGLLLVSFQPVLADHHAVGPGFFGLVGYEIVSGREFTVTDVLGSERVAIVNRSFANEYFERGDPLGRSIRVGGLGGDWFEVIGVVEEPRAMEMGAQSSQRPTLYLSALQVPPARATLLVRPSSSSTADLERLAALTPLGMASGPPSTLATVRRISSAPLAWLRQALMMLAAIALFVVVVAVRAAMRVSVERSAAEIGLRMAVGATPARIWALVIRRSFNRLAWGTVVGVEFGLGFLAGLELVIPEISPPPIEWVLVWTSFLFLVAVWGAWGPARHAAKQDPARVLARI